jgi:hypothetical protein
MPVCLPYPFPPAILHFNWLTGFLDRIGKIDLGPGPAELLESSDDDDQRRETHACSCHMLGKLHAASATESV